MPGKSNKFDYTNRSSKGVKLGDIIRNALEKEADKIIKDGEKHSQKQRGHKATVEEEYTHQTRLDIVAKGGELGDKGVAILAEGLETALAKGTDKIKLTLEHLCLSNNAITSTTLRRLTPSIILARGTIKTLDLSYNKIKIETKDEAEDWATFLRSFDFCTTFHRLDLTGNTAMSSKALEIFCELHVKSIKDIAPIQVTQSTEARPYPGDDDRQISHTPIRTLTTADADQRSGLRSIPYIILDDIGLSDVGAMWLSRILETHYFPCQLLDGASPPTLESKNKPESQGISWAKNETTVGKEGRLILQKASEIREQLLIDASSLSYLEAEQLGKLSPSRGRPRTKGTSLAIIDGSEELQNTIRRVQRSIIEANRGPGKVDLWRAALRVITLSRAFAHSIGVDLKLRGRPCEGRQVIEYVPNHKAILQATREKGSHETHLTHTEIVAVQLGLWDNAQICASQQHEQAEQDFHNLHPDSAGTDFSSARTDTAVVSADTTPPKTGALPQHIRKDAFSLGSDAKEIIFEKLKDFESTDPDRFIKTQQKRTALEAQKSRTEDPYRKKAVPSHLPHKLMKKIVYMLLTKREIEAMTDEQFEAAFAWGQDRSSLSKELEWAKGHLSVQVLKLLEEVACLEHAREEPVGKSGGS